MRRALSSLTVAAAAAVVALHAQAPPGQQPFRVGTNLVRVDVYPTRDGQIVSGLQASDFEVLEDGVPQKIETFEHVIPVKGAHTARVEPNSQRDMVQAVANPRNRVFLIFLDATHVTLENSHAINEPLFRFLRDVITDDDLVGVMTPEMTASSVAFGRSTEAVEQQLKRQWDWGRRGRQWAELDTREIQYEMCFPALKHGNLAQLMGLRRRERATLEALQDAVRYLGSIREERKAIVTITQGWPLYTPDPNMLRQDPNARPTGVDKVRVGREGTLTTRDDRNSVNTLTTTECDSDRLRLAQIDDDRFLLDLIDDANRANASFYMIDPAGLSVSPADRSTAMRTLAGNTDGVAALNSNDLNTSWDRIAADLSSYYLLGYYATNTKPDGRFRAITVRVKQRGIQVRARRGYRAPTEEEIRTARRAEPAPVSAEARSVAEALAGLARIRPDGRFRINAALISSGTHAVWIGGEVQSLGGRPDEFLEGATAFLEVVGAGVSASTTVTLKPGERTFLTRIEVPSAPSGTLDVRARLTSVEGKSAPLTDAVRLDLERTPIQTLLYRRGVTTGNRLQPAGDPRFSRIERLRLEIPSGPSPADGTATAGRVIDRGGLTTKVPVTVGERVDAATSQRWLTADVTLGALSPGDYIVELTVQRAGAEHRVQTGIRVER